MVSAGAQGLTGLPGIRMRIGRNVLKSAWAHRHLPPLRGESVQWAWACPARSNGAFPRGCGQRRTRECERAVIAR